MKQKSSAIATRGGSMEGKVWENGGSDVLYIPSQGGGPNELLKGQKGKKKKKENKRKPDSQWTAVFITLSRTKRHQKGVTG